MAREDPSVVLEGYLTLVRRDRERAEELYLHSEGSTYRLCLTPNTRLIGAEAREALPLGPSHPVRVAGSVGGDALLPSLRGSSVWVLEE